MFNKIEETYVVHAFKYIKDKHTFELTVTSIANKLKKIALFTQANFPNMGTIKFLDEKVTPYENVTIFLKDAKVLEAEGYKKTQKGTLYHKDKETFKIGSAKARSLGQSIKGKIGVTEKMKPYVFDENGYRFTENEIQLIIKDNFLPTTINAEMNGIKYDSRTQSLRIGAATVLGAEAIRDLKRVLKSARIV